MIHKRECKRVGTQHRRRSTGRRDPKRDRDFAPARPSPRAEKVLLMECTTRARIDAHAHCIPLAAHSACDCVHIYIYTYEYTVRALLHLLRALCCSGDN